MDGDVDLNSLELTKFPLKFRNISGNFYCGYNTVTIEPSFYSNRIRFTAAADLIGIEELQIILQLDNYLRSEGFSQESLFVFKINKIGRIGDSNKISGLSELLDILNNDNSYKIRKISIYYNLPELFYLDADFKIEI